MTRAMPLPRIEYVARSVAPVFPIRMLALDIDGTLVGEDLILHDRTRAAVLAAVVTGSGSPS